MMIKIVFYITKNYNKSYYEAGAYMKKFKLFFSLLLCFSLVAFSSCTEQIPKEDTIATVDGKAISKSEYMVYLYEATKDFNAIGGSDIWDTDFDGQPAEEVVKERAFTTMLHVKITADRAEKYQVSLSDSEKQTAKLEGDAELASMTQQQKELINISEENMYHIMEETLLYQKVINTITQDYQPSEADFNAYFQNNKENQRTAYTQYTINNVLIKDRQTAQEVAQRLRNGEAFEPLFETYEIDPQEKALGGTIETYKNRLDSAFGIDFNLEEGEVSDPLPATEGYFVIQVTKKSIPDDTRLEELMRIDYTTSMRQQVFTDELNQWLSETEVERNETVWNTIEMIQ